MPGSGPPAPPDVPVPPDPGPIALSAEDRAILELEGPTIVGHTCKVVHLAEAVPIAELRRTVGERLAAAPLLTRRLGGSAEAPAWVPVPELSIADHVVERPPDRPLDRPALLAAVSELFATHLDRSRPLWRVDAIPLAGGGQALVWRIHHALADGMTAIRLAHALLWDPEPSPAGADSPAGGDLHPGQGEDGSDHGEDRPGQGEDRRRQGEDPAHQGQDAHRDADRDDQARRRAHLAGLLRREFARSVHRAPFDGEVGTERRIAFAEVPLRPLHDAARGLADASLNDAVLATVAGSLRHWIEHHHGQLGTLRVKVPVSLHQPGDAASNRDSFFSVPLPLTEPDPVARLREVRAATAVRKAEHDAEALAQLLAELGAVSPQLRRLCERIERSARAFAVNVSNVPGPRRPVSVLGSPVRSLHTVAEISEHHALRVAVVSLVDKLCFGLCADPGIVDGLDSMAASIEAEAESLISAYGA